MIHKATYNTLVTLKLVDAGVVQRIAHRVLAHQAAGTQSFDQWWVSAFPGLAILTLVMAFNFIGDGVRDALDPRLRRSM
jgi:ABC-type microcin C transport system permease subunit YejE